jgi:hypothetical protein
MITTEQFTQAMKDAVAFRGEDFTYPEGWRDGNYGQCRYQYDGNPACIIGEALSRCGVELQSKWEGMGCAEVLEFYLKVTDPKLLGAAQSAQSMQDNGDSWGGALKLYLERIGE